MKLTSFGREVRVARMSITMTMETMAKELGVSVSYVSSMECSGKSQRKLTSDYVERTLNVLCADELTKKRIHKAADETMQEQVLDLSDSHEDEKLMVGALARRVNSKRLTRQEIRKIMLILSEE